MGLKRPRIDYTRVYYGLCHTIPGYTPAGGVFRPVTPGYDSSEHSMLGWRIVSVTPIYDGRTLTLKSEFRFHPISDSYHNDGLLRWLPFEEFRDLQRLVLLSKRTFKI